MSTDFSPRVLPCLHEGLTEVLNSILSQQIVSGCPLPGCCRQDQKRDADGVPQDFRHGCLDCMANVPVTCAIEPQGAVRLQAKASAEVDECSVNGRLLDGEADLSCS